MRLNRSAHPTLFGAMTAKEPQTEPQAEVGPEPEPEKAELQEQPQAKAEALKEAGNKAFRAGSYRDAAQIYADAAEQLANESDATVLLRVVLASNAAECHLRLDEWEAAEKAAKRALDLDPEHAKSVQRLARAKMALDMLASAPVDGSCTEGEARAAASTLVTLRRPETRWAPNVTQAITDRGFAVMAAFGAPNSIWDVMADILEAELERPQHAKRGSLTYYLLVTHTRAYDTAGTMVDSVDGPRCLEFLRRGTWPNLLALSRMQYDKMQHVPPLMEMMAKPLQRWMTMLLAQHECANYVLENHSSRQEVAQISDLMVLGETEKANEMEGLTNTCAALLAVCAEEAGNAEFEPLLMETLYENLDEQEQHVRKMTYTMLAKPNAKAMWSRGRVLSHGEFANQVKANMAMQAAEGA